MKEKKKGKVVSFYVDEATLEQFTKICNDNGLKLSPVVEHLMKWFISKQDSLKED